MNTGSTLTPMIEQFTAGTDGIAERERSIPLGRLVVLDPGSLSRSMRLSSTP